MMNARKTGKHGAAAKATDGESGRKHLTSREVERLIEAELNTGSDFMEIRTIGTESPA
jgi:hypothetical protein